MTETITLDSTQRDAIADLLNAMHLNLLDMLDTCMIDATTDRQDVISLAETMGQVLDALDALHEETTVRRTHLAAILDIFA